MKFCLDNDLPILTMIVVYKGSRYPSEEALKGLKEFRGTDDIESEQKAVFKYPWATIPELAQELPKNVLEREVWLTSFWGFYPQEWGCLGFNDEGLRNRFIRETRPGALVAIYVTKSSPETEMRGNLIGFLEVSHEKGDIKEFMSPSEYEIKENDPSSKGKWSYALRVTRAWQIIPEEWQPVGSVFPSSFSRERAQAIGAQGVRVTSSEVETLSKFTVFELPVFGERTQPIPEMDALDKALSPSRAVTPAKGPYTVTETDGPKDLYILKLNGDIATYLKSPPQDLDDYMVIKVGFSKSPRTRRNQIQSAYPDGTYRWEILYPKGITAKAPYPNAEVAIAGEDAMKEHLVERGAISLGGEFFLARENLVHKTWFAGKHAAEKAMPGPD